MVLRRPQGVGLPLCGVFRKALWRLVQSGLAVARGSGWGRGGLLGGRLLFSCKIRCDVADNSINFINVTLKMCGFYSNKLYLRAA